MTIITNNAEGGTDGAVATTANSGGASGTAFAAATTSGVNFKASAAAHGSMGYECTTAGTGAGYVALSGTPTGPFAAQAYVKFPTSLPASGTRHRFLAATNNTGGTFIVACDLTSAGTIELTSTGGFIGTASGSIQTGRWYRVHLSGTTGTSGNVRIFLEPGEGGAKVVDSTWNRDMGATLPSLMVMGQINSSPAVSGFQFDDMSWQPDAATEITANPVASNTATVTPNAGLDFTCEPGVPVTMIATGWDQTNAVYNKGGTWSQVSGPAVTLTASTSSDGVSLATFTPPKATTMQTIVLRLTQAGPNGIQASDDVTITVPPHPRWIRKAGAWSPA